MSFLLSLLIQLLLAHAQGNPCGDFFRYACTEGNQGRNDGTGSVKEMDQLRRQFDLIISTETNRNFSQPFDRLLQNDTNLRNLIANSIGCSNASIQTCPQFDRAVVQIKEFVATINATHYGRTVTSDENTIVIPVMSMLFILDTPSVAELIQTNQQNIEQRIAPLERRNHVRDSIFPQVRAAMQTVLQNLPDSPKKQEILTRLNEISLTTRHCNGRNENLLTPNGYYRESEKTIDICLSHLFTTDSLFSDIHLIAHELAHSIDPESNLGTQSVFSGLTQCLSHPRNMGIAMNHDAMNEAFCDWMANEVLAQLIQTSGHPLNRSSSDVATGLANARPTCAFIDHAQTRTDVRSHPLAQDRLSLMTAQPILRQRMGCTNNSQQTYCPLNGLPAESINPPPYNLDRSGVVQ